MYLFISLIYIKSNMSIYFTPVWRVNQTRRIQQYTQHLDHVCNVHSHTLIQTMATPLSLGFIHNEIFLITHERVVWVVNYLSLKKLNTQKEACIFWCISLLFE